MPLFISQRTTFLSRTSRLHLSCLSFEQRVFLSIGPRRSSRADHRSLVLTPPNQEFSQPQNSLLQIPPFLPSPTRNSQQHFLLCSTKIVLQFYLSRNGNFSLTQSSPNFTRLGLKFCTRTLALKLCTNFFLQITCIKIQIVTKIEVMN